MIKACCEALGMLLSYLLPLRTPILLRAIVTHIYTGFVRKRFAALGRGTLIAWPVLDIKNPGCIQIGEDTEISTGAFLSAWPGRIIPSPTLRIGNHCHIGARNLFSAALRVDIGDHLLTGPNVIIVDNSHGNSELPTLELPPTERPLASKGEVVIGRNVWLGANVCILPGVHIGDCVTVAAGSVVTHDVPSYSVAAGVPARVIRTNLNKSEV